MASPSAPYCDLSRWSEQILRMPDGERHEHWRLEKKGVETILRKKGIEPGNFIFVPINEELDDWRRQRLYLYRSLIPTDRSGRGPSLLTLDNVDGYPMFVEVSTWAHPQHPEWQGIPCIKVLVDVVYMLGHPNLHIRRVAKTIQKL